MGKLVYGSAEPVSIPDTLLAHLQVVIATKLSRHESLTLSWRHPADAPTGRTTLWIHQGIPLRFEFESAGSPALSRAVLQHLIDAANTTAGIAVDLDRDLDSDPPHRLQKA